MSKLDLINKYLKDELRDIEFDDVILKKKIEERFLRNIELGASKSRKDKYMSTPH
ncbi:hypothetical protein ACYJ2D_002226 [Providencia stuartii]